MKKIETALPGVFLLEPDVRGDHRGYFMETYNRKTFSGLGLNARFVQNNQSYTQKKGTLRGIHFQNHPMAQCKFVWVVRGRVMDMAVDLRKGSPCYLQWVTAELTEDNKRMFYIPRGFGHAFVTLSEDVTFCYMVDQYFFKEYDRGIRYNDPQINVEWGISEPILSEKDQSSPFLENSDCNFAYER